MDKFGISHFTYVIGDNWKWTSRSTILLFVFYLSCLLSLLPFFSFSVFFWINQSFKCFFDSSVGKDFICNTGRRPWFDSWVGNIHWRRDRLPTPVFLGFPCGSAGKESACNAGDLYSISGLGRSPGEGKGYPLQYSGLENSMDCIVHGIARVRHN